MKANGQRLRPRELELTAADELVAMENISVLKQNGFEILVEDDEKPISGVGDTDIPLAQANERAELGMTVYNDEEGYEGQVELEGQSGSRRRVQLVAQPISGNTVFDVKGPSALSFELWLGFNIYGLCLVNRLRRAATQNARPSDWHHGTLLQSASNVCQSCLQKKYHGWYGPGK